MNEKKANHHSRQSIKEIHETIPDYESLDNSYSYYYESLACWSTSVDQLFANSDLRLDAPHYDPVSAATVNQLRQSGYELNKLKDLASVELRPQFTRVWAKDSEHGVPYLNATDLLSLLALGTPAAEPRYLSYATDTDIDALVIRHGWLLMTCSGTIGRVFYVPKRLDGWVATHDLIRIIPNGNSVGYLLAWLSTSMARSQIFSHTHGGQIDHVTDQQVAEVLVPELPGQVHKEINTKVMKALEDRETAIETLLNVWPKR